MSCLTRPPMLVAFALPLALHAQSPTATTVRVLDQRGAPVPHAVLDVGGGSARVADDSGRIIMHFDGDSTTVRIRRLGFSPFSGRLARADGGEVTVTLAGVPQRLAPVTVETQRDPTPLERTGFYDRVIRAQRGAYNAEFVTPEELDSRIMTRLSDAFRGRRFIKVVPAGRAGNTLKGRAGCSVTVLLDGQPVRDAGGVEALAPTGRDPTAPKDAPKGQAARADAASAGATSGQGSGLGIDELVSIGAVAAIEMYSSANIAPVELLPISSDCAVVAIWTGRRH